MKRWICLVALLGCSSPQTDVEKPVPIVVDTATEPAPVIVEEPEPEPLVEEITDHSLEAVGWSIRDARLERNAPKQRELLIKEIATVERLYKSLAAKDPDRKHYLIIDEIIWLAVCAEPHWLSRVVPPAE